MPDSGCNLRGKEEGEEDMIINADGTEVKRVLLGLFAKESILTEGHIKPLDLFAVEEVYYPHPNCPDDAMIQQTQTRLLKTVRMSDADYSKVAMLFYAGNVAKEITK